MSRNLQKFTQETNRRLILGFVLILILVGDGLILLIYGPSAALSGLICIGAGLAPFVLIWAILIVLEWVGQRTDQW